MSELVLLFKIILIPSGYVGMVCFAYWYRDYILR